MGPTSRVSRRNFIKAAALGGTAVSAAPALGQALGANDRINVGLIGIGSRGTDHLDLLLAAPGRKAGHRDRGAL